MQTAEILGLVALAVQLAVAIYVLPLSIRITGSRLVSWVLFAAFLSMFVLRFAMTFPAGAIIRHPLLTPHWDELFALTTSGLLLFAMFYIDRLFVRRRQVEEELREAQERFTHFADNNPAVAWIKDDSGRFVYVNKPFERMFRTALAQLKGKTGFEIWPENIARQLREHDTSVLKKNQTVEMSETVPDADGNLRQWWVSKFPFSDRNGRKFVFSMAMDVTEQRKMEEAVRDSERRFRSIWENSADGMRLTDEQGTIIAVNPAYCKLVGLGASELEGQSLTAVHPPENREKVLLQYCERFRTRIIESYFERKVALRCGKVVDLEVANSFLEHDNQPALLIGIFRDITERRQAEEQRLTLERKLLDSQKLESLGILAGGIAHDFNNLLTAIMGNASLAQLQMPEGFPARQNLVNIEKTSIRAAGLCRQMLAYSGRGQLVVQDVALNSLVDETAQLINVSINKKIALKFNLAAQLPCIQADPSQIQQVIMNLVINASEAIGDNSGVINITTGVMNADTRYISQTYLAPNFPSGNYVFLEVSDTGCGMTPDVKAKIFDPFFTTKFTGRGLGLAAVLGIMRGHKGSLKVYSEPGRGSSFKLLLPCNDAKTTSPKTVTASSSWRGQGTILVVDDEESVRIVTARMLENFGFSVLKACDGREGVETFRKNSGDIQAVVLDMTMPRLNGDEAFREIRRINPAARVLLMSGYNEQDATDRFAGKGLAGFLQKPFRQDDLRDKLRMILEKTKTS